MHLRHIRSCSGLALLLASLAGSAAAQGGYTLRGTVVDAANQRPLANVTVSLRGTNARTLTSSGGQYSLNAGVAAGSYTLTFTALGRGMATRPVTLGGERTVEVAAVQLREQALELEGLVVTGQGTPVERRRVGNTVATVRGDEINQAPAAVSIDRALQGRIPGAVISQNSGSPGAGTSINLRGTSSILGGNEPLVVVDGVIIENNSDALISLGSNSTRQGSAISNRLNDLATGDIERVEVLKGAAAAALYGSRANNGVIQIFTRRGAEGRPRITYSSEVTTSAIPRQYEVMDLPLAGPGDSLYVTKADGSRYRVGEAVPRYNVQDEIFRTATGTNQQISLSSGSAGGSYYLSGSWLSQPGVVRSTGQDKKTVRGTVTQRVSSLLEVTASGTYIRNETSYQPEGEQTQGGLTIALFTPTSFNYAFDPVRGLYPYTPIITANPLVILDQVQADANVDRFIGSMTARITPLPSVTLTALAGLDDSREENVFLQPPYSISPTYTGLISNPVRSVRRWNTDLTASWETEVGSRFGLTSTAGFRYTSDRSNIIRAAAEGLPPSQGTVGGATQFASQGITELRTAGGYLQERLAFGEQLFVTGAVNVEGSSAFGADVRYQTFPRLGFSWVVDEMPFWEGLPVTGTVSSFRLRGSYGETGGQPPSAYLTTNNFVDALFGGRPGQVGSTTLANPDLRPERQREYEAGFDLGLWDDRVTLELTAYDQRTTDLVLLVPLQLSSGFSEQYQNIGQISNRGLEISLGADVLRRGRFAWDARFTYAANRNRVEQLRTDADTLASEYLNIVTEGQPIGVFYGAVYPRDADGNIVLFNGRPRRDRECPAAGCLTAADSVVIRRVIGDPNPDFTASLSNHFTLGDRLELSVLLDGRFGNDVANFTRRIQDFFGLSAQTEQEARGEVPVGYYFSNSERHLLYEAFVEDGSFVKLREVSLGVTLDPAWVRRFGAEGAQVRLAGRNLHTWTDYSGVDPEINLFGGSTIARGVDFVTTPIPRSFSLGLTLNF
jgi:TonB-dependent starch-binding outer membrane protein SusC